MLALFSCFDKSKTTYFAKSLKAHNYQIRASLGTAKHLAKDDIDVLSLDDLTGFNQLLHGRVKTLDAKIHAAILAKKDNLDHQHDLKRFNITAFDLVYVDLYPFEQTVKAQSSESDIIEMIDIGGVSLIRAAAKNYHHVLVVTNKNQIDRVIEAISQSKVDLALRKQLAKEAFNYISNYDKNIAEYFLADNQEADNKDKDNNFILDSSEISLVKKLRYGENPHQEAALYQSEAKTDNKKDVVFGAELLSNQSKSLSFNNIIDAKAAYKLVLELEASRFKIESKNQSNFCVIIKHSNPCGVGFSYNQDSAFGLALKSDPISAFGGICGFNNSVDEKTASLITKHFFEVIVAPSFSKEALDILSTKKNLRLISYPKQNFLIQDEIKSLPSGYIVQTCDDKVIDKSDINIACQSSNKVDKLFPYFFAWQIAKSSNSNAIIIIGQGEDDTLFTLGIGLGQTNRLLSAKIACRLYEKSELNKQALKVYAASDGFFPFTDGIEVLAKHDIKNIIQPSGSKNDGLIVDFAKNNDINLIFTNFRHFKH